MPIITQCPHCKKKLKAPDAQAGKQAKCPQCAKPFVIQPLTAGAAATAGAGAGAGAAQSRPSPRQQAVQTAPAPEPSAPAQPQAQPTVPVAQQESDKWYIQIADGTEYGPVTRQELDQWLAEDRIDTECQILCDGWDQWKWAEDVYPQLAGGGAAANPFAGIADSAVGGGSAVGVANPYASPQASGIGEVATGGGSAVTPRMVAAMEGTRPWVLMFAILNFIGAGFAGIGVILSIILVFFDILAGIMNFVFAAVYMGLWGYIGYLLFNYARSAGTFARTRNSGDLEKALDAQKSFWKTVGILTLVMIAFSLLMVLLMFLLVGSVLTAVGGAAAGAQ